ncbi:hypothetical protein Cagg_1956 [Chloroflexus aggregans DSM 9485]|uniref:Uncharacterized protein n=1 Tax=Chloroflexus aggregans (strain MD-66 / DSM 9485) TaxID=326427 RepID=B8GBN4_CHLAD|nr:hypothetical protein Cagg_1956 [Chloroflexus aggregans DSM 9485]
MHGSEKTVCIRSPAPIIKPLHPSRPSRLCVQTSLRPLPPSRCVDHSLRLCPPLRLYVHTIGHGFTRLGTDMHGSEKTVCIRSPAPIIKPLHPSRPSRLCVQPSLRPLPHSRLCVDRSLRLCPPLRLYVHTIGHGFTRLGTDMHGSEKTVCIRSPAPIIKPLHPSRPSRLCVQPSLRPLPPSRLCVDRSLRLCPLCASTFTQ